MLAMARIQTMVSAPIPRRVFFKTLRQKTTLGKTGGGRKAKWMK
jgi:hypothetical protein